MRPVKFPVFRYSIDRTMDYKFYSPLAEKSGNVIFLMSNSLVNLKKEIKKESPGIYHEILSYYEGGFKQEKPFLVSLYKPRGNV